MFHLEKNSPNASLKCLSFPLRNSSKSYVRLCFTWRICVSWCNGIRRSLDVELSSQYIPQQFLCPFSNTLLIIALVPINLRPDSEIIGPTSLNAVNFITLGIPLPSEYGKVTVESFSLENGWLFEQSGLSVHFAAINGLDENEYGVTATSVLKAAECGGGCSGGAGGFCVDKDGYLVSVVPLGTAFFRKPLI